MKKFALMIIMALLSFNYLSGFETEKKPYLASALSLLVPGGGQFYNEKYIKAGIVFGTGSFLIGSAIYHNNRANHYWDKVENLSGDYNYNVDQYNKYYSKLQNDYWWIGTTTFISLLDAFVDANLHNYKEKKKNLHMKFEDKKVVLTFNFY
ncbi:MAG: DUF5683 domain-containing protein [Candidatus Cloacimonetes bacterium]|nr:DUF5683 domain-containing protein [Candidatus Cloacimonadota bacterium]